MYRKSKGSKFMKKNKSQLSTKQEKKLRRRIKFMLWTLKVFTKENVLAAICGITIGLALPLMFSAFMQGNLLGGFGFGATFFWAVGTWTAFIIGKNQSQPPLTKEEIKKLEVKINEYFKN